MEGGLSRATACIYDRWRSWRFACGPMAGTSQWKARGRMVVLERVKAPPANAVAMDPGESRLHTRYRL